MKDGFIKVAAAAVAVTVADVRANTRRICEQIDAADRAGVNLLVLPELCVTGYTCGDLFLSQILTEESRAALTELAAFTSGKYPVTVVGLPLGFRGKLYNCAAVLHNGRVLGIVPKIFIPNYGEFYEMRHFASGAALPPDAVYELDGQTAPFGTGLIFRHDTVEGFSFGVEICEDLWAPEPPSGSLCRAGAVLIANPSASDEVIGKADYRRLLVAGTSARLLCGYIYSGADSDESTQDMVFSRHALIYENGTRLSENRPFAEGGMISSEIDVQKLIGERRKNTSFMPQTAVCCREIVFSQPLRETALTRKIEKNPFVPARDSDVNERAGAILAIQSHGLKKRLAHTGAKTAVIGISGGLDSTLALLAAVRAMRLLSRPASDIVAVTMPCFGTTARTKSNAVRLCELLGVTLREINITAAVTQHFADIGHAADCFDVTYENSQARERTQVLMDIANQTGGLVVGTGDLSELALGWATYNGDHMSMYAVNCSVPKTLVRYIVRYEAAAAGGELERVLGDILDTPVSPELLPVSEQGDMTQKTEDLVGPYELHDFFLYHMLRCGESPAKIFRLARRAFAGEYDNGTILKWLTVFTRRFFSQQFKRSCLPDGPKVGTVTLSPRGDWRMPSDASARLWLEELEQLTAE